MNPEVCEIVSQDSLENGFIFESFDTFESFTQSDSFKKFYDLGANHLKYDADRYILQLYWLSEEKLQVMNLQRMFVVLWYMDIWDFQWMYSNIESDFCSISKHEDTCNTLDPFLYFGVFGYQTDNAVRNFQSENDLVVDGIVWETTKWKLYTKIYNAAHNINNRFSVFQKTNQELRNLCHENN